MVAIDDRHTGTNNQTRIRNKKVTDILEKFSKEGPKANYCLKQSGWSVLVS